MVMRFFSLLVETACTGKPNGDIPHPYKCVDFINCFAEMAYVMHCPHGLHFNPAEAETYSEPYQTSKIEFIFYKLERVLNTFLSSTVIL